SHRGSRVAHRTVILAWGARGCRKHVVLRHWDRCGETIGKPRRGLAQLSQGTRDRGKRSACRPKAVERGRAVSEVCRSPLLGGEPCRTSSDRRVSMTAPSRRRVCASRNIFTI